MSDDTLRWLATTLLFSFTVYSGIFVFLLNDKVNLGGRWILFLSLVYTLFSDGVLYLILLSLRAPSSDVFWIVFSNSTLGIIFALAIIVFLVFRYRKGVNFGEEFIAALGLIDLQINLVLSNFQNMEIDQLERTVNNGLSYVLDTLTQLLDLYPDQDDSHISVLLAQEGAFKVVAQKGIPPNRIKGIEEKFRYGTVVVGVAGGVATSLQPVYIPDLNDKNDPRIQDWIPVVATEKKPGCLYCYPLIKGVGENNGQVPLAVVSITSKRKHAFDRKSLEEIVSPIASKIETFIYLLELHDFFDNWLEG